MIALYILGAVAIAYAAIKTGRRLATRDIADRLEKDLPVMLDDAMLRGWTLGLQRGRVQGAANTSRLSLPLLAKAGLELEAIDLLTETRD